MSSTADTDTDAGSGTDARAQGLLEILRRCSGASITVVGDLMLDEYIDGTVERISPEAPVPVVCARGNEFRLGGAANVAGQIAALGAKVSLIGIVGDDADGQTIERLCEESGIGIQGILRAADRRTTKKIRVLSRSQQLLRIDWEDRRPGSDAESAALLASIANSPPPDAIVLSDYAKGVLTASFIERLMRGHRAGTSTIVVDPKHRDLSRYRGAKVVTPNLRELSDAAGGSLDPGDLPGITGAARAQLHQGGFESMVVTLGAHGMLIVAADGTDLLIPAIQRAVYDVTGAGDTAAAVLTACLAAGASIADAARIANTAAGIAVGEIGAVAVSPARIAGELSGIASSKLLPRAELLLRVKRWRDSGQRIVFTNGCFDLLHPGHLSLLNFAKSQGDILVLAINSDASVRRLKGPGRPVLSEQDRAAMLGALACVDAVTIFDEDTPLDTIRRVKPDILVKGRDYRIEEVIGRDIVEAAGGRVVLAPLLPDYSTTSLLARTRA
jgi:D-beta-D-heptose 7-phosphate kinase/D-beta-D-heptose 1-phosphate adenosyltransferase